MPRMDLASRSLETGDHPTRFSRVLKPILWRCFEGIVAGTAGAAALALCQPGSVSRYTRFAVIVAAIVVAMSLLQICRALVLRWQIKAKARHAEALTTETRSLLEARHPGVAARAAAIDPEALIDRVIRPPNKTTAPN
jgi:hypothetical protein